MVILTLLFGLVVFAFARDLAGPWAGVLGLAAYSFSPDVIANGSLATNDVPAAGFVLTAAWLVYRARQRPLVYLPLAGVALGAALSTKFSALPALVVVPLLAIASVWYARERLNEPRFRKLGIAALSGAGVAAAAIAVIWITYLPVGTHWIGADIVDGTNFQEAVLRLLPVPAAYRDGLRFQFTYEAHTYSTFLLGRRYGESPWYYLPAAMAIKTPIGAVALWLLGVLAIVGIRRLRSAVLYVLIPGGALFLLAMNATRGFGVRYGIAVPIFLAVAAGCAVAIPRRSMRVSATLLAAYLAVSSLLVFPYYLTYANEAFGGPSKTHTLLHDSNVDWGQDLRRVRDRLRTDYPGETVWLVYQGGGHSDYYGIHANDPLAVDPSTVHGILVVSYTRTAMPDAKLKAVMAGATQVGDVGHSIGIYRR